MTRLFILWAVACSPDAGCVYGERADRFTTEAACDRAADRAYGLVLKSGQRVEVVGCDAVEDMAAVRAAWGR